MGHFFVLSDNSSVVAYLNKEEGHDFVIFMPTNKIFL